MQWNRERRPLLAPSTLDRLQQYRWPGNIRELRNVIERAVLFCSEGTILPEHVPLGDFASATLGAVEPATVPGVSRSVRHLLDRVGDPTSARRIEREVDRIGREIDGFDRLVGALDQCAGNQTEAARVLGISRRTLINRLETHGIPRPRKRPI